MKRDVLNLYFLCEFQERPLLKVLTERERLPQKANNIEPRPS
jgi:hypothetical protein